MGKSPRENIMSILGVSAEEADEILAYDKEVDQGKPTQFDLDAEKEKVAKKMRQADRKPTAYKFTTRKRKPNETKGELIHAFSDFLYQLQADFAENSHPNYSLNPQNIEITNPERMISFTIGENSYEIMLTQKRKPKN